MQLTASTILSVTPVAEINEEVKVRFWVDIVGIPFAAPQGHPGYLDLEQF